MSTGRKEKTKTKYRHQNPGKPVLGRQADVLEGRDCDKYIIRDLSINSKGDDFLCIFPKALSLSRRAEYLVFLITSSLPKNTRSMLKKFHHLSGLKKENFWGLQGF